MIRDATQHAIARQLFVAHSSTLCENARRIYLREAATDTCGEGVSFVTLQRLVPRIEAHFRVQCEWPKARQIDYPTFHRHIWPSIELSLTSSKGVSALLVWKKLQSVLKGSVEAVEADLCVAEGGRGVGERGAMALTKAEYLALGVKHERLDEARREIVYKAAELYHAKRPPDAWDQADRVLAAIRHVGLKARKAFPHCGYGAAMRLYLQHEGAGLTQRLYADEVQDCTPAELLLLMLACGGDVDHLFLGIWHL